MYDVNARLAVACASIVVSLYILFRNVRFQWGIANCVGMSVASLVQNIQLLPWPLWCWSRGRDAGPGPCLTTATWRCRKYFSQWERSFLWKLRCHWLKGLRQRQIAVVKQGPAYHCLCASLRHLIHLLNALEILNYCIKLSIYSVLCNQ